MRHPELSRNNIRITPYFLGSILAVSSMIALPCHAEAFKWTDENGVTTYSQTAPNNVEQVEAIAPPRENVDTEAALERTRRWEEEAAADRKVRESAAREKATAAQAEADKERQCKAARARYAGMEARPKVLTTEPDGTVRRLDDDERLARMAEAQKIIDETCK